jgi:replicative DNA helicase
VSSLEQKVLAYMTDATQIGRAWDMGLRVEAFEDPMCRAIYAFTVGYWLDNQMQAAPTPFIIEHELPGFKLETQVEESLTWLVESLQKRYVTNQLQEMILTAAKNTSAGDPVNTLRQLYSTAYDVSEAVSPRLTRSVMDNIAERRQRYAERANRPDGIGFTLGVPELDAHTGGLMPGELAVVGAYAKTGKTMFLVNTAAALRREGKNPIFFTLEMSIAEIEDRIDAMYSGVSYNRLTRGQLTLDEMKTLHSAQERLHDTGGVQVESPEGEARTVAAMVNRARQVGADYIIIDQLSHMEPGTRVRDLKEHHGTIMKQLSTELSRPGREIPCLLAVQLNRESQNGEPVSMKHFANASEIEREMDIALALERNAEERRNKMMRLHILASRRADSGSWALRWDLTDRTEIAALGTIRPDGTLADTA